MEGVRNYALLSRVISGRTALVPSLDHLPLQSLLVEPLVNCRVCRSFAFSYFPALVIYEGLLRACELVLQSFRNDSLLCAWIVHHKKRNPKVLLCCIVYVPVAT